MKISRKARGYWAWEMVTYKNVLIFNQILLITTTGNIQKTVWRIAFGEHKDVAKTQKQITFFFLKFQKRLDNKYYCKCFNSYQRIHQSNNILRKMTNYKISYQISTYLLKHLKHNVNHQRTQHHSNNLSETCFSWHEYYTHRTDYFTTVCTNFQKNVIKKVITKQEKILGKTILLKL